MNITINNSDLASFMQLPANVRLEIEHWQSELAKVAKPIQKSLRALAARMGVSTQTARRKYDLWRKAGGRADAWRALVNRSKLPEERGALTDEFLQYWKTLCLENARKCAPAYRKFVREFKAGAPIAGIDPTLSRRTVPRGFSYDNLMRHAPTAFEAAAARIGRAAAADFRPKLVLSRVGLEVGMRKIYDDLWHDFEIGKIGQRTTFRLLQLHAHDLLAACNYARGLKSRVRDELTNKSVGLTENEMLFLLAYDLGEFGYHPKGTVLMVEHGTAAIREPVERLLYDLTGGRVTVERSGIQDCAAFAGQYGGAGKGNFRFKASLESSGNLIHNETADMLEFPGQTGFNSRLNKPEELEARKHHAGVLLKALAALPAESAALLRLPFLEETRAKWLVNQVMERINQRTDHNLEGWLDCGFTTIDLEIPDIGLVSSQKYLSLPPEKQAAVMAVATPLPRKLSPREVFDAGRGRLIKLRPEQTALLLKDVAGKEVPVSKDRLLTFEDEAISTAPLHFKAHHFAPGDKFTVVVNPMAPGSAHLFNAKGGWVGVVDAWQGSSHGDIAGLHRQMGEARKIEAQLLAPVAAAGHRLTKVRLENALHNASVLNGVKTDRVDNESLARNALANLG